MKQWMKQTLAAALVGGFLWTGGATFHSEPALAASVSKLEGFQTLRWGDSVATVKAKLAKKFKYCGLNDSGAPYYSGEFGGYREVIIVPGFVSGKLVAVAVNVSPQGGKNTLELLRDLMGKLMKVYGKGSSMTVTDYATGNNLASEKIAAMSDEEGLGIDKKVLGGHMQYSFGWEFPNSTSIQISTERTEEQPGCALYVSIGYYADKLRESLEKSAVKKAEESALKDF